MSSGQTFYARAAGLDFDPRSSSTTFAAGQPGCIVRIDSAGQDFFVYDLQLPQGAIIDYLSLYYYDVAGSEDLAVELLAHDGAGNVTTVESLSSAGSGGFGATGSGVFSHMVDDYNESLLLQAYIPDGHSLNLQLCGIRVRYQFDISTNHLPAILNLAGPLPLKKSNIDSYFPTSQRLMKRAMAQMNLSDPPNYLVSNVA